MLELVFEPSLWSFTYLVLVPPWDPLLDLLLGPRQNPFLGLLLVPLQYSLLGLLLNLLLGPVQDPLLPQPLVLNRNSLIVHGHGESMKGSTSLTLWTYWLFANSMISYALLVKPVVAMRNTLACTIFLLLCSMQSCNPILIASSLPVLLGFRYNHLHVNAMVNHSSISWTTPNCCETQRGAYG